MIVDNKENMNISQFEQETERIHREYIEETTCDTQRSRKDKRTVSDNSRPMQDQNMKMLQQPSGMKVLHDKTNINHSSGNVFALKKPVQAMATERSHTVMDETMGAGLNPSHSNSRKSFVQCNS